VSDGGEAPRGLRVLLGGSFDPVHAAHLALADAVQQACSPRELVWVPAARSPFKDDAPRAEEQDRLAWLRAVVEGRDGERVDDRELHRPAPSYTVDTLESFAEEDPSTPLALAMGADSLAGLARWHRAEELVRLAWILVAPRPESAADRVQDELATCQKQLPEARLCLLPMAPVELSATAIRAQLARGEDPGPERLPRVVFDGIRRRQAYGWPGATA
jgi:nicotinate-nucleotide adenylyltransferase